MRSARLGQAAPLIGLALIATAVVAFDRSTPFPGLAALLPTLGTALVILFATSQSLVGRVLGSRPLVGIGLLSYSAYLWHQPLFAFARQLRGAPSTGLMMTLALVSLGLAWASWALVERPFRSRLWIGRRALFGLAAAGSLAFVAFGVAGVATQGMYFRAGLQARLGDLAPRLQPVVGLSIACATGAVPTGPCRVTDAPEVLLWGDSFAMHLVPGLLASDPSMKLAQVTLSLCGPVLGAAPYGNPEAPERWARRCLAANDAVIDYLRATPSIRRVVLGSSFRQYAGAGKRVMMRDGALVDGPSVAARLLDGSLDTLRAMGISPVVVSPMPQTGADVGACLVRARRDGLQPQVCDLPRDHADAWLAPVLTLLQGAASRHDARAEVIWLSEALCDADRCRASYGDVLFYRDTGHLTREGSAWLGQTMDWAGRIRHAVR